MTLARVMLASLLVSAAAAGDEPEFQAASLSPDELVFHATRYGNTPRKRAEKALAKAELFGRKGEGLRLLMERAHVENVMIGVLAQELTESLDDRKAVPVLLDFVNAAPTNTRRLAVFLLGFHEAPKHASVIRPLLDDDALAGVAARTLGKWRDTASVDRIIRLLGHPKERVRVAAANALRDIGDPAAAKPLIRAMGDPVFTVRNTAQRALVSLGPAAVEPLFAALKDARPPQQRLVIESLGELKVAARGDLLAIRETADEPTRDAIDRALAEMPKRIWDRW